MANKVNDTMKCSKPVFWLLFSLSLFFYIHLRQIRVLGGDLFISFQLRLKSCFAFFFLFFLVPVSHSCTVYLKFKNFCIHLLPLDDRYVGNSFFFIRKTRGTIQGTRIFEGNKFDKKKRHFDFKNFKNLKKKYIYRRTSNIEAFRFFQIEIPFPK